MTLICIYDPHMYVYMYVCVHYDCGILFLRLSSRQNKRPTSLLQWDVGLLFCHRIQASVRSLAGCAGCLFWWNMDRMTFGGQDSFTESFTERWMWVDRIRDFVDGQFTTHRK
jgi:hypothetical protein